MTTAEAKARELVAHEETIAHEAGHYAAAIALGLDVTEVRVDRPDAATLGRVSIRGAKKFPRETALVILAGPQSVNTDSPRWPLSEQGSPDEKDLKELIEELGYGPAEFAQLEIDALTLSNRPRFQLAQNVMTDALKDQPVINGELLETITHLVRHRAPEAATKGNAEMRRKSFELEGVTPGKRGTFSAMASVFNNVDAVGDRMLPGAFRKTLRRWRESDRPLPVIFSHAWEDPMAHIGYADPHEMQETDAGLQFTAHLDVDDNEMARQVHRLMKRGTLTGMSFGYTVPPDGERKGSDGANEVSEVDLIEVGPTLKGANPEAQLLAIKSNGTMPDAAQRARAAALGIKPPERKSEAELRRLSDSASLQAALGFDPPPNVAPEPDGPSETDLRRRTDDALLDAALGWEPVAEPEPEPEQRGPTDAELRRRAAGLGLAV